MSIEDIFIYSAYSDVVFPNNLCKVRWVICGTSANVVFTEKQKVEIRQGTDIRKLEWGMPNSNDISILDYDGADYTLLYADDYVLIFVSEKNYEHFILTKDIVDEGFAFSSEDEVSNYLRYVKFFKDSANQEEGNGHQSGTIIDKKYEEPEEDIEAKKEARKVRAKLNYGCSTLLLFISSFIISGILCYYVNFVLWEASSFWSYLRVVCTYLVIWLIFITLLSKYPISYLNRRGAEKIEKWKSDNPDSPACKYL